MTDSEWAVTVEGLHRSYGPVDAVAGVDFAVRRGEIFGLLGPNGAGKTTTIEMLEGHRRRDGGDVRVLGVDPAHATRAWREKLGIVLQDTQIEPERGTLKRVRGTPVPLWAFIAGRVAGTVTVTIVSVILVVVVGRVAYGVAVPGTTALGAILTLTVATAALCAMAFAASSVLPSGNVAAAITMTLTLALYFLSGIFAREDNLSHTIRVVAAVFPIKRLFRSLAVAFDPQTSGTGIRWWDLAVLAAWGLGALLVALRFFRWQPDAR